MREKILHYYHTYGLNIASEIELPELLPLEIQADADVAVDIRVSLGNAPAKLAGEALRDSEWVKLNANEFIFQQDSIARYYAKNGSEITVEPYPGSNTGDIRLYLLGTVFGVLLHQRGDFPLHSSAILLEHEKTKGVVAFCGNSGAGKSTLLHSFSSRGFQVLGDDVGVIRRSDNINHFYPGFPRVKLWQDALDHFEINSGSLTKDLMRMDKYHLKIEQSFYAESAPLTAVIKLVRGAEFKLTEKKSVDAVAILMANTYRPRLLKDMGKKDLQFRLCSSFLQDTRVFCYQRPWSLSQIDQGIDYLLESFKQWH